MAQQENSPSLLNRAQKIPTRHKASQDQSWWRDPELNRGHADFQSAALPTELSRHEY